MSFTFYSASPFPLAERHLPCLQAGTYLMGMVLLCSMCLLAMKQWEAKYVLENKVWDQSNQFWNPSSVTHYLDSLNQTM